MQELTNLSQLKDTEFSILFFYAKNCKFCEMMKPIFEKYSENYSNIGFFSADIGKEMDYFLKYAEEVQEVIYEEKLNSEGNKTLEPVYQLNEDGSPKMSKKIIAPSFYVHHTQAATEDNEFGFCGGFDGYSEDEIKMVCEGLSQYVA